MIFTGIQTLMGTIGMPTIGLYWSNSFLLPIISKSMTRNRFTEVRTHISFVNNLEHEPTDPDKLWKVRPLLEGFRKVCLTLPRSVVYSIDEQMIPFNGRCPARQYLPSKPNPVGLKVFVFAAPDGTMLDFIVYQGRGTTSQEDTTNFDAGGAIVKALVNTVPKTGCSFVFTDRYFTGLKIAEYLLEQNIYLTGTIMKNQIGTIKKKLKQDKLMKRGDWEEWALEDESMCLLKWKDKKAVLMLSTAVGSEPKGTCLRWSQEERKKIEIPQPAIVNYYNKSMGGVDLLDRLVAYYRTSTRTCRWTLRVFLHLIDLGIVNSWTLYKRDCKASETPTKGIMKLMEFRLYIAEALIKTSQTLSHTAKVGRPSKSPQQKKRQRKCDKMPIQDVRFDGMNHFPEHVPGKFQSRCRNSGCNEKCRKCEVYLCLLKRNCFTAFHQK